MRLLHTSDWHLGMHFYGRSLLSDQEYVLDQMINLVRDLKPDVLVVAGDVFHHRRPSEQTLQLFHDTINRLIDLETKLVFLSGPTDDFSHLNLGGRWVRDAGVYLLEDATQVLSPLVLQGRRDNFEVSTWCLPFPKSSVLTVGNIHPALFGFSMVEKVVQRLNPNHINLFLGYAWVQDSGRKSEFGNLVTQGGRPLESRLLEFFDLALLGASHEAQSPGGQAHYSGSLLCYEPDAQNKERSVTLVEIEGKGKVSVDRYPLKARRKLKILEGSWEELLEQGRDMRSDDLVVLRSEERKLSPQQRAELRILGPNVVSVEVAGEKPNPSEDTSFSALVQAFKDFAQENELTLDEDAMAVLERLESEL